MSGERGERKEGMSYIGHLFVGGGMGAANGVLVDLFACDRVQELHVVLREDLIVVSTHRARDMDFADARDEGNDLDAVYLLEVLFCDRTCSDTTCRL